MTSYLTLLLATLGIMIGLFTVTGFINRMGAMILDLGASNMIGVILMAYVFGWLAGAGLPPTATYIIGAIVIVRPLQELGVNPWIAHFFVFLLSVWGELSPPTSLTAAVSARIAEASFMRTMYEALQDLRAHHADDVRHLHPLRHGGEPRLAAGCRHAARFHRHQRRRVRHVRPLRGRSCRRPSAAIGLAAVAFVVLLHPDRHWAMVAAAIVVPVDVFGIWRHVQIGGPEACLAPQDDLGFGALHPRGGRPVVQHQE